MKEILNKANILYINIFNKKNIPALLLLSLSLLQLILSLKKASFVDFYAYWGAGKAYFSGINPYANEYQNPFGTLNFIYPPGAALIFIPISLIPINISLLFFTVISFISFIFSILLIFSIAKINLNLNRKIIILSFLIQTQPFKITLALGQINNILLFLIILSLYFYYKKRIILSSFIFSLSVTMKLIPAILLPFFIKNKYILFIYYFLISLIFLNLLNPGYLLSYFVTVFRNYWPIFQTTLTIQNQSISTLIFRLTHLNISPIISYIISIIIYIYTIFFIKDKDFIKKIFIVLSLSSISQYVSWQHHLILAIPLLVLFAKKYYLIFFLFWFPFFLSLDKITILFGNNSIMFSYQTINILVLISIFIFQKTFNKMFNLRSF